MRAFLPPLLALSLLGCDCFFADNGSFHYDPSRGDLWCPDDDGDGYPSQFACRTGCTEPNHWAPGGGWIRVEEGDAGPVFYDCGRDSSAAVHPGGIEICDGLDNDCDGGSDELLVLGDPGYVAWRASAVTVYRDRDSDGWGNADESDFGCPFFFGPGWVERPGDCNDGDRGINPGVGNCTTDDPLPVDRAP